MAVPDYIPHFFPMPSERDTLSIDPGIGGTGWAFTPASCTTPSIIGCVTPPKRGAWEERFDIALDRLSASISRIVPNWDEVDLVIEIPAVFSSTRRGIAAAGRGDVVKIALLAGGVMRTFPDANYILARPSDWKGQLPKKLTERALRDHLGPETVARLGLDDEPDHTWDAVGIGLWYTSGFLGAKRR